jgi:hypothetical protein
VNKFQTKPLWLKIVIALAAILLPIALLWVAPCLGIREGGKISLSRMQLLYGILSSEIAVAVYMWGVGNWSRFEPPQTSATPQTSDPAKPQAPAAVQPVQAKAGPPAQPAGAPLAPQGGR